MPSIIRSRVVALIAGAAALAVLAAVVLRSIPDQHLYPDLPDAEALRRSVASTRVDILNLAFAIDSSFCLVVRRATASRLGYVECKDVPLHLFKDVINCDSKELDCRPEGSDYTDCVDYEWDLDMLGAPRNPLPYNSRNYLSGSSGSTDCNRG